MKTKRIAFENWSKTVRKYLSTEKRSIKKKISPEKKKVTKYKEGFPYPIGGCICKI